MKIEVKKRIEIGDKIIERSCSAEFVVVGTHDDVKHEASQLATALFDSMKFSESEKQP